MSGTLERIPLHLHLPHRPPRAAPARAPPQAELDLDQTSIFDLDAPDPVPEVEFDQSSPHGWDA